ncbi:serine/threonine-protein kinase [Pseudonocardia sp. CA-107938]|uniref:serine/threonine-protein kinase n=1 Tax=Pseudonocardia sp. CA-107938 TaxID=3240021 RepID=UPI003D8C7548
MGVGPLATGALVGDFEIAGLLGRGGMGVVYRARQRRMDRFVALKVLSDEMAEEPEVVARFLREAAIMRDLEHPGIVPIHDAGTADDGRPYLAMRLLQTRTLRDVLADGPLAPDRALRLLTALADALDHAHAHGVVHRDVKPANVLLDAAERPYLADFGIAKALADVTSLTLGPEVRGTPLYMAPEQRDGRAGHRSDLYSLACVAFEMLTGAPPFPKGGRTTVGNAHALTPPPAASERRPELPGPVDAVFERALAKRPVDRYGSGHEFVAALEGALGAADPGATTTVPASRAPGARSRGMRSAWLVAAVVVVLLVGGGVLLRNGTTDPSPPPAAAAPPIPTATATPSTTTSAAPAARTPPVAVGEPLHTASFDTAGTGFVDSPGTAMDLTSSKLSHDEGALRLEATAPGGYVYAQVDMRARLMTYVVDLELSVRPGSDVRQCLSLRWAKPGRLAWYWCLRTATGTATFARYEDGYSTDLTPAVPVPDLQSGRTVAITIQVDRTQLTMYVDGVQVATVTDDRVPTAPTIPGLELSADDGTGQVSVTGLRYWRLPAPGGS